MIHVPILVATCTSSGWSTFNDQNSLGATLYPAAVTIRQCLDYCESNPNCLAVDIEVNVEPARCWPHFNSDYLSRAFRQAGTNQYRIGYRCQHTTPGQRYRLRSKYNESETTCSNLAGSYRELRKLVSTRADFPGLMEHMRNCLD